MLHTCTPPDVYRRRSFAEFAGEVYVQYSFVPLVKLEQGVNRFVIITQTTNYTGGTGTPTDH